MQFAFWTFVNGSRVDLDTTSIFSARRVAREAGGDACYGYNPSTKKTFML